MFMGVLRGTGKSTVHAHEIYVYKNIRVDRGKMDLWG